MFWKKKKKETRFFIREKDFRELVNNGATSKEILIDGEVKNITISIHNKEDLSKEKMSSIICESYYKSRWYN